MAMISEGRRVGQKVVPRLKSGFVSLISFNEHTGAKEMRVKSCGLKRRGKEWVRMRWRVCALFDERFDCGGWRMAGVNDSESWRLA